jgi:hypothetical protein
MISTWFLFCTFFSNISITKSIIPYLKQKAQHLLDFFDKLRGTSFDVPLFILQTKTEKVDSKASVPAAGEVFGFLVICGHFTER